jgi:hypothetical protein
MFRRALLACLLAIALTACAGGPALFGPSTGTVIGHVQLRACRGASLDEPTACPPRPMPDVTIRFQLAGTSTSSTTITDSTGSYRVDLKPGTYTVQLLETGSAKRPLPGAFADKASAIRGFTGPRSVTVVAGQTVTADFSYTIQMQ